MKMYYGTKEEVKNITDKSGNIVSTEIISKGKSGNSLTLTIDMELQKKVEESIEKNLRAFKSSEPLLDRAFVVMTNQITDKFYQWQAKDCRKRRENRS